MRRNLGQLEELVGVLEERGRFVEDGLRERLETGRRIFEQQMEMYRERKHRVDGRIVSFHRDYVHPSTTAISLWWCPIFKSASIW